MEGNAIPIAIPLIAADGRPSSQPSMFGAASAPFQQMWKHTTGGDLPCVAEAVDELGDASSAMLGILDADPDPDLNIAVSI